MTYTNHENCPSDKSSSSHGPTIAAIDLGTNSCRLLIAKVNGQSFRIVDSFSRVVRLGEGVQTSALLTQEAIDRTIDALRICKQKINHSRVSSLRAVATEACRMAENRDELISRARMELGLHVEVITPEEEARLALAGCAGILNSRIPYAIAFDIGGGSTEVMWLKITEPRRLHRRRYPIIDLIDCISLPCGVVTLSDRYNNQSQDPAIYKEIQDEVAEDLKNFSIKNNIYHHLENRQIQMIGTSGTVTTLTAMSLGLERYDRKSIDGTFLESIEAHQLSRQIFQMTKEERSAHCCIGPTRVDLVVMGMAILEGILNTWPIPKLRVADRGVREGILMELIKSMNPKKNVQPKLIRR